MFQPHLITKKFLKHAKQFGLNEQESRFFCNTLNRLPSSEELAICGELWSEHCSYKSSGKHLKKFYSQEHRVLQGAGKNAGIVQLTQNYALALKMESHNRPSFVEPYQGAATGVGGILRDVFCMGAFPIANINCLRFGEGPRQPTLLRETVRGIGNYGNCVGVPTLTGDVSFHHNYSKNILVNALTAGVVHKDKIIRGLLAPQKHAPSPALKPTTKSINVGAPLCDELQELLFPKDQNVLVYFGSATGKDGIQETPMSSFEFPNSKNHVIPLPNRHTVQVGDPFAQKLLLDATLALIEKDLVVGLQNMGAAGLTSSTLEMAGRTGCGVALSLNAIPTRSSNMHAWEILLSKSQERILCAVLPHKLPQVLANLEQFHLSYAIVGNVNQTGLFTCIFDNTIVTATPISLLVDEAPCLHLPLQDKMQYHAEHQVIQNHAQQKVLTKDAVCDRKDLPLCAKNLDAHTDLKNNITLEHFVEKYPHLFVSLYAHPANASRAPVYHNYCSTVQGNTVAGSGALQMAAAGVVRLPKHVQQDHHNHTATPGILGLALAAGCEERWVELNPFEGTALSVLKIARKLVATGAKPLAMTNCLNFGNPQSPTVMRQLCDAIEGMNYVAKNLHIPVVSSNVSLNNQTHEQAIAPTPMVGLVGTIPDLSHVPLAALPKQYFKKHEQPLSLVHVFHQDGPHISSYLASQTAWILGGENSCCPKFNLVCEKALWDFIFTTLTHHKPKVCVPIGHGGLLGTLITLSLNSVAPLELEKLMWQHKAQDLFREGSLGFVLGFSSLEQTERFLQQSDDHTFHKVLVGQLKPQHCKIQKPLFHFDTVEKEYAFALQRYFSPQPWGHREAT